MKFRKKKKKNQTLFDMPNVLNSCLWHLRICPLMWSRTFEKEKNTPDTSLGDLQFTVGSFRKRQKINKVFLTLSNPLTIF